MDTGPTLTPAAFAGGPKSAPTCSRRSSRRGYPQGRVAAIVGQNDGQHARSMDLLRACLKTSERQRSDESSGRDAYHGEEDEGPGAGGGGLVVADEAEVAPPPSCRSCHVFAAARNPPWTSADRYLFACLAAPGKRVPLMDLAAQPERSAVEPLPGGLGRRVPLASPRRRRPSRPARTYRDGWRESLAGVFHLSCNGLREPGMDRGISDWHDAVSSALSHQTPRHLFIVPCFFPRRPAVSR